MAPLEGVNSRLRPVAVSDLPEPPYPPDTQAGAFAFEIDVTRLVSSDTWDLLSPEIRPWWLMLLVMSWRQVPCGAYRDDMRIIAAKIGASEQFVRVHREELLRGWYLCSDGRLYHPVISDKIKAFLTTREKWRCDKKQGYRSKFRSESAETPRGLHHSSAPSSSSSSSKKENPPSEGKRKQVSFVLPDGVDPEIWEDFEVHRRSIRKPLTDRARTLNAHVLLTLTPEQQRQSVEDTIRNRWTGLFQPKTNGARNGREGPIERIEAAERAVDDAKRRRDV